MDDTVSLRRSLHEPWLWSLLCLAAIPVAPEYYGAPLLALIAFVLALRDGKQHPQFRHVPLTGQFLLLYTAVMILGLIWSHNRGSTLVTVAFWVLTFPGYLAATRVINSRGRLHLTLYLVSLAAGIVGAIAIVQHLLAAYTPLKLNMQFYAPVDGLLKTLTGLPFNLKNHGTRASSTFANPNMTAEYLVMALPFVLYYSLNAVEKSRRKYTRIALVLLVFGLFFTYSRGSYIAALVIAVCYVIRCRKGGAVLLLTCVAAVIVIPNSVVCRLFSLSQAGTVISDLAQNEDLSMENGISDDLSVAISGNRTNDTYVERLDVIAVGGQIIGKYPVTGVGAGLFTTWEEYQKYGIDVPHAHNLILQLLIEGGIPALLLMLCAGGSLFIKGIHLLKKPGKGGYGIILLSFFLGFVCNGLVDFPLLSPKLVGIFLFFLAVCDAAYALDYPAYHSFSLLPKRLRRF